MSSGIIEEVGLEEDTPYVKEVISNIFLREKSEGHRVILNLKEFNTYIEDIHFKMDTLRTASNLMRHNAFFAKVDLKDAYFSVKLAEQDKPLFRFLFQGNKYQFRVLPQGYKRSPLIFTKLLKPALSLLRSMGYTLLMYIDDLWIQGEDYSHCKEAVRDAVMILDKLGFTIHPEKSRFEPDQEIEFLGFVMNSTKMTISISQAKSEKIRAACRRLLEENRPSIRMLSEVIGQLVAAEQGNKYAPIFYKRLEILRNSELTRARGNYEKTITISLEAKEDLEWWIENVGKHPVTVEPFIPDKTVYSDSSNYAWGGHSDGIKSGGYWSSREKEEHINVLELTAAKICLFTFCKDCTNHKIQLFTDNSTVVASINKKTSNKGKINNITREIWLWCMKTNNIIRAAHIPGVENVTADKESRQLRRDTEWKLNPSVFEKLQKIFGNMEVDMFASRLNYQIKTYVSWVPDDGCWAIDAFSVNWMDIFGYCFPPFSIISRVLQKIEQEGAEMVIIVPIWTTQAWFPKLMSLLTANPRILPQKNVISHPVDGERCHRLQRKLKLVGCRVSGKQWKNEAYRQELVTSSWHLGDQLHSNSTVHISGSGQCFVYQGRKIPCVPL